MDDPPRPVPNPVPGSGHFKRALLGHFCQAPKRVDCPECGAKAEKVPQLPSKSPYSKRFEDAVGQACESASARQVARRMVLAESTVRGIDLRYLERCEASRRQPPLRHMGVDELYRRA